ncbi:chlorophyll synthesis pathway protein BchC [Exophiala mesophila]|uniref:Chlorophyll synthesis pathway protein BchC n=1 Tax=Exophiala mesophila TaxID=212818 RepID=A0A0D1Z0H1_EXOME|nr:chlorophyll synthesis pathway protein BchC [Exophiala mesophila]KIV88322.1 chlorophyll synthesis pathway protein BchC [Exophiala mesophila]
MRAARYYGKKDIRVEEVPIPKPGPNQCLIEIEWCGICGSDLHEYIMGPVMFQPGITIGHEFCGRVKEAPRGSKLQIGQAVMIDPRVVCSSCSPCKRSNDHCCQKLGFLGCSPTPGGGGLSEFVAADEDMLYPLPDTIGLDYAAIIEPLVVAYHAIKTVPTLEGLDVLILGGGPIGLAVAIVLQAEKVKSISVSEPAEARKAQAKGLVDRVIDPTSVKVGDVLREATDGKGVDIVFDCAGVPAGLDTAFDSVTQGGTYVSVALWEKPFTIPFLNFLFKEVTILASCCYNRADFAAVMKVIGEGKYNGYEKLVTSRIPLEDVSKGFEELVNNKDNQIKIMISPKLRAST